jgi:hypothetical protein
VIAAPQTSASLGLSPAFHWVEVPRPFCGLGLETDQPTCHQRTTSIPITDLTPLPSTSYTRPRHRSQRFRAEPTSVQAIEPGTTVTEGSHSAAQHNIAARAVSAYSTSWRTEHKCAYSITFGTVVDVKSTGGSWSARHTGRSTVRACRRAWRSRRTNAMSVDGCGDVDAGHHIPLRRSLSQTARIRLVRAPENEKVGPI